MIMVVIGGKYTVNLPDESHSVVFVYSKDIIDGTRLSSAPGSTTVVVRHQRDTTAQRSEEQSDFEIQ